jgi:hypothetical protein
MVPKFRMAAGHPERQPSNRSGSGGSKEIMQGVGRCGGPAAHQVHAPGCDGGQRRLVQLLQHIQLRHAELLDADALQHESKP